jgi:hypothetical protein
MASGSSGGRPNCGSKGFDFASDDILCSYEDYDNVDASNGSHSDSAIGSKDFRQTRLARPTGFPTSTYSQPDDSYNHDMDFTSIVERITKKHSENVLRFLEGLSSRLSQLELYCYNLDKSIGEMRNDLVRDHEEGDSKLKAIEKHLQEVHRSVQLLRDKQELAETQNELAKLQLAQKESSSSPSHSQSHEERASPVASDNSKKVIDNTPSDMHNNNQQLALALPHQVAPQQQPVGPPPVQNVNQQQQQPGPYYLSPAQISNQPPVGPHSQNQYQPSDTQYRVQQPTQSQVTPTPPGPPFPHYQQQWPQQQQPTIQPQIRPILPNYPPYPGQTTNSSPSEQLPNSMPMQIPYSGVPQPMPNRADAMPYGYGGPGRTTVPQQPPQTTAGYGGQPGGDGYSVAAGGPHPNLPPGSAYMIYDGDAGRVPLPPPQSQQPHMQQGGGYPPPGTSSGANNLMPRNRNNPYGELIEKMMSMGFRGEHVVGVIQRMEESGQQVDFNSVLDRLNVHSSGSPQRGWSG